MNPKSPKSVNSPFYLHHHRTHPLSFVLRTLSTSITLPHFSSLCVQGISRHWKGKAPTQTQSGRGIIDEEKKPFDDGENNNFSGFNDAVILSINSATKFYGDYDVGKSTLLLQVWL
ncbi:hypothetical protein QL285_043736 [Trifolium repens]|nr:hypothetical protein QL285_043736 [Trifolium repens]